MNLYPITAGYCTSYLVVFDDQAMLIDAASPETVPQVLSKLDELHARLNLVVLTHYHFDHVGGADAIREATGARVAIHRRDSAALRAGGKLVLHPTGLAGRAMVAQFTRDPKAPVTPDLEFGDAEDLSPYGAIGRTFATPGHTPGSQSVLLPDGTVLVGDALTQSIPTRHAAGPIFADSEIDSHQSIVSIADVSGGDIYIAHGGLLDRAQVQKLGNRYRTAQQ